MHWKFAVLGEAGPELDLPWAKRLRLPKGVETTHKYHVYSKIFYDQAYPLEDVELEEGSAEVDFIGGEVEIGGIGLMISEKALNILQQFNLPPHEIRELTVLDTRGEPTSTQYFWLHILKEDEALKIDFAQSLISHRDTGDKISSLEH